MKQFVLRELYAICNIYKTKIENTILTNNPACAHFIVHSCYRVMT